jgi:Na+-transporting methylmalonyl-CoA/oxaloacetate decarboxylase gamma subunit
MGILGFMLGALIVILLRGLQSLDPLWAPGPGIVMAVIMTAVFFIWGMGAFDPRLSIHGDPEVEEAVHEELATEAQKPRNLLFSSVWQLATAVLVLAIVIGGFAVLPGGLALTQTVVPGASLTSVGYADVPLPFGGPTVQVSTLVIFAVFVIWAFISLAAVAAVLGWVFSYLSRGLVEVKAAAAGGGTVALPAPEPEPRTRRDTIRSVVIFLVTFVVLYFFFYYVAIGLIMPEPELPGLSLLLTPAQTLVFLSAVNALIFTLIILRTQLVLETVGRVARWLAKVLRAVPKFLQ